MKRIAAVAIATTMGVLAAAPAVAKQDSIQVPSDSSSTKAGAIVRTTDGTLRGTVTEDYRVFKGVRYAAPAQRWVAPQPPPNWRGVQDATRPGADCVQTATFWRMGVPESTTEDCLYLNVYTPRDVRELKPVQVFFHGGGDRNGAATDVDPWRMATWGDSIVVSANYRLGVVGGLFLPALDAESADGASGGNYGNLDKIQVLNWIKENIATFGGDPDRVTIGGQSAGAEGACWLLASPTAAGLFSGAALESALACGQGATKAQAAATGQRFADAAGCTDVAGQVACLRSKSPSEILAAQVAVGSRFLPVVGGSDMPLATDEAFASGRFNRVPIIVGHTRRERTAFTYESFDMLGRPVTSASFDANVRSRYGAKADAILAEYSVGGYPHPGEALSAVRTDEWACGHLKYAQMFSDYVPTWAFEFADETSPLRSYMTVLPSFPIGSGHTSDVPYLWNSETATPLDRTQQKTSRAMIGSWAQFARIRNPNGRKKAAWPPFVRGSETRVRFLAGGATDAITGREYRDDHRCGLWLS